MIEFPVMLVRKAKGYVDIFETINFIFRALECGILCGTGWWNEVWLLCHVPKHMVSCKLGRREGWGLPNDALN